jgi:hypothetical protein
MRTTTSDTNADEPPFEVQHHDGGALSPTHVGSCVLFILARWSPDAVTRLDALLDALNDAGYLGRFVVVDHGSPQLDAIDFARRFGLTLHGWGEAFVVHDGKVLCRSSAEEGASIRQLADYALAVAQPTVH